MSDLNIKKGVVTPDGVAMPEWLSRRDSTNGAWQVQQGQAIRGDAWTNRMERVMRVPFGTDEQARVVRAHEMMHAKASPLSLDIGSPLPILEDALRVAEEFRVNTLCKSAGFDIDALRDGSESGTGKRLAENADWNNFVLMICATAGGKACKDLLRGATSVDKAFAEKGKRVEKAIADMWKAELKRFGRVSDKRTIKAASSHVGSSSPTVYNTLTGDTMVYTEGMELKDGWTVIPAGFMYTIKLGSMIDSLLKRDDDVADDGDMPGDPQQPSDEELDSVLAGGNTWATLVVDRNVPLTRRVKGHLGRKRIATNIGINPRRMERLLTDPDQRVFDRYTKGSGGVVLIDQSGSMRLSDDDLWTIVNASPGCVVIGYSHQPRSVGVPNLWVLANRGKVCAKIRSGNGGNGVDFPALAFAQKLRKKGEPFVWVCDGVVTVADDDIAPAVLQKQVVNFVAKHNIHNVETVNDAVDALKRVKNGGRLPSRVVGRLKQYAETGY